MVKNDEAALQSMRNNSSISKSILKLDLFLFINPLYVLKWVKNATIELTLAVLKQIKYLESIKTLLNKKEIQ